jgi:hypothetical protein
VDTFTTTTTVTGIDTAKRTVTLVSPGGSKSTYKAGPEVVNFAQIQIGDQVEATVTEEVAIFIGRGATTVQPDARGAGSDARVHAGHGDQAAVLHRPRSTSG